MAFQGKKQTKEHIEKRMQARRKNGWFKSETSRREFVEKCSEVFKGRVASEETKVKMSIAQKKSHQESPRTHTPETRLKMSLARKGVPKPTLRGENAPGWKGGVTSLKKIFRQSLQYRNWRSEVYERDNYTCQDCGNRGGELNPDHVMPLSVYPEMKTDVLNGRTLCKPCHKKTDTYGGSMWSFEPEMTFLVKNFG